MINPYRIAAEQPYYPPEVIITPSTYAQYSNVALCVLGEYWSDYFRDVERKKMKEDTYLFDI